MMLMFLNLFSSTVFAFTLNSSSNSNFSGWSSANIKLMINTSNCGSVNVTSIIENAASVWNNVATSRVNVSNGGTTSSTTATSPTTVYCETNFNAVTGADQNSVPAGVISNSSGNNFASAVLVLNVSVGTANITNYSSALLTIILAHEIGHVLGLGHSDDANALMYYNASAKQELKLAQDDMDGVSYLYPRDEFAGDKAFGCASVGTPKGPSQAPLVVFLFLIPVALWSFSKSRWA